MSAVNIYGIPGSPFMASVIWVAEERGAPWIVHPLRPGDHKQPAYLARQPFGRIPAIEHDGFALYETQAILRYLADVFPGDPLTPSDPRARARMSQQIGVNDWYFFPKAASIAVFERLIKPVITGQPADEEKIRECQPMARLCVAEIERLMEGGPWLAGATLSLADFHLAPQFFYFSRTPEGADILAGHPQLMAWLAAMTARPALRKTMLLGLDAT